ncbi:unnamed protein product [Urochloa humidicola]
MASESKRSKPGPSAATSLPPPGTDLMPASFPLDSLGPELVDEVLLRLPSHAALACKRYLHIICSAQFRRRFRALHPSSRLLIGHYFYHEEEEEDHCPSFFPSFYLAGNHPCLEGLMRRGDFLLFELGEFGRIKWRIHDCFQARLLLSTTCLSNRSITIFNPISKMLESVCDPPSDADLGAGWYLQSLCLLPSDYRNSTGIRVAGFQRRQEQVRLAVYESRTCQWKFHPWVDLDLPPQNNSSYYNPPMHACGCVYWKYLNGNQMLRLDSSMVELSTLTLPPGVVMGMPWSTGETEDGEHCLVCVMHDATEEDELHVWIRNDSSDVWELKQRAPLRSKAGIQTQVREVRVIVDGLVILCLDDPSIAPRHVALNLTTLQVEEETCCRGLSFPYIMPWHLAVLT